MPYFSHAMAETIQTASQKAKIDCFDYQIRSLPGNAPNGASVVFREAEPATKSKYRFGVTQRKLMFTRSLIQAQVEQANTSMGPWPVDKYSKLFHSYTIDRQNRLIEADNSMQMFAARSSTYPDMPLLVRIYPSAELQAANGSPCLFLRILRHLGRKHPNIISTLDLFTDQTHVYVFQELAVLGNLMQYLEQHSVSGVVESQLQQWAKQLFRALDFLGDQAIAHRRITPNHILMKQTGKQLMIKLTGFKHSILYWDPTAHDIVYCPCWPAARQHSDGPNFQAPEVYGNPEEERFDPILADTWSYGANVYFMAAKQYPYNMMGPCADIDVETGHNIRRLASISEQGRDFLSALLRANANDRISFDFINRHAWLHPRLNSKSMIETPYKGLKKVMISSVKSSKSHGAMKSAPVSHSSIAVAPQSHAQSAHPISSGGSHSPSTSVSPSSSASSTTSSRAVNHSTSPSSSSAPSSAQSHSTKPSSMPSPSASSGAVSSGASTNASSTGASHSQSSASMAKQ